MRHHSKAILILALSYLMLPKPTVLEAQLQSATKKGVTDARSEKVNPRLVLAVSEFQARWQIAWRYSEQFRAARSGPKAQSDRHKFFHCDVDLFQDKADKTLLRKTWGNPEPYYMIKGRRSAFGVCPSWLLTPRIELADDESSWRDGAILAELRPSILRARANLIAQLHVALALEQRNDWIVGQLVRFASDQRDYGLAKSVVDQCAATPWWCAALDGFVSTRMRDLLSADSGFQRMRRLMPDSIRVEWDDLRQWLPEGDAAGYDRASKEAHDPMYVRFWWLSDPLYREPGNARRVEHDVRQMEVALRSATTQDERYSFDEQRGGDAVATMIRRYGWPTYTGWAGLESERSHSYYLERNHRSPPAAPYTTFEYTVDRVRVLPSARAVVSPFESLSSDWELLPKDPISGPITNWWPEEHFRHRRRLVQLPDGQTIAIRRHSHVEVVSALTLSHSSLRTTGTQFDVMLLSTTGPEHLDSLDQQVVAGGANVVLRGNVRRSPTLLAIEALGIGEGGVDARTRFGYRPPEPLSALRSREIALSDLALLRRLHPDVVRSPNDTLLKALLPSTRLSHNERTVTLYWESYGTTPEDSATIAVRVASDDKPGVLQSIAVATGLINDPSSTVTIRWKDSEGRASTTTLRGPVPVQMRALDLNLATLRAGKYTIEVLVTLADGRTAASRTLIELLP
jgi:hypothetical protein